MVGGKVAELLLTPIWMDHDGNECHDQLRSTLSLLIKRQYFLDRWIGDKSLLSILHNQYNLHSINKYYLNRYIQNIGLNDINIFYLQEDYLVSSW